MTLSPLEQLEQEIYDLGIDLIERRPRADLDALFVHRRGHRPRIYIDPAIRRPAARYVLLAEELGHYYTTTGDILPEATPHSGGRSASRASMPTDAPRHTPSFCICFVSSTTPSRSPSGSACRCGIFVRRCSFMG